MTQLFSLVDEIELSAIVRSLKSLYSCDPDNFTYNLLKCIDFDKRPLLELNSISFSNGTFPGSLKIRKIKPILENGDKNIKYLRIVLLMVSHVFLISTIYLMLINLHPRNVNPQLMPLSNVSIWFAIT